MPLQRKVRSLSQYMTQVLSRWQEHLYQPLTNLLGVVKNVLSEQALRYDVARIVHGTLQQFDAQTNYPQEAQLHNI